MHLRHLGSVHRLDLLSHHNPHLCPLNRSHVLLRPLLPLLSHSPAYLFFDLLKRMGLGTPFIHISNNKHNKRKTATGAVYYSRFLIITTTIFINSIVIISLIQAANPASLPYIVFKRQQQQQKPKANSSTSDDGLNDCFCAKSSAPAVNGRPNARALEQQQQQQRLSGSLADSNITITRDDTCCCSRSRDNGCNLR